MINYARSDTHYLLYIYDLMRNDLAEKSETLLKVTLDRSAETSLKTYENPIYDAESGEGSGGWKKLLRKQPEALNVENFAIFRAVHGWRDHVARNEDESPVYVMPNHIIFKLARFMPTTAKDLVGGCSPVSPLTRAYAVDIAKLIEQTLNSVREKEQLNTSISMASSLVTARSSLKVLTDLTSAEPTLVATASALRNSVYLERKESSILFGDLFKNGLGSSKIASKIEDELILVAPSLTTKLDCKPTESDEVVDFKFKREEKYKILVMKGEASPDSLLAKRKQPSEEITSLPISTTTTKKVKGFDFESAILFIQKEPMNPYHHPSFDPQTEHSRSGSNVKAVKGGKALKKVGKSGLSRKMNEESRRLSSCSSKNLSCLC
jgi:hypothetical protein